VLKICAVVLTLGLRLLELAAASGCDEDELKLCAAVLMLEPKLRLLELAVNDG
jgi:hypothetical protein